MYELEHRPDALVARYAGSVDGQRRIERGPRSGPPSHIMVSRRKLRGHTALLVCLSPEVVPEGVLVDRVSRFEVLLWRIPGNLNGAVRWSLSKEGCRTDAAKGTLRHRSIGYSSQRIDRVRAGGQQDELPDGR